jgi:hypothetical protein
VLVNQGHELTKLAFSSGAVMKTYGGGPASRSWPRGVTDPRAPRGVFGGLAVLGLFAIGVAILVSAVRNLDHTRWNVRPAAMLAGTAAVLNVPAQVHMMLLKPKFGAAAWIHVAWSFVAALEVLTLVVMTCSVVVALRLFEHPPLPRLYGLEQGWRLLLGPLVAGLVLGAFCRLLVRTLGAPRSDPYAALAKVFTDPVDPNLRAWLMDLPTSVGSSIYVALIAWGVAFPWIRRKFVRVGRAGPWAAVTAVVLAQALPAIGSGASESMSAVATSLLSAVVTGVFTSKRNLEDGIAAQVGFSAATGFLGNVLRVVA